MEAAQNITVNDLRPKQATVRLAPEKMVLSATNLSKTYGDTPALSQINVQFKRGETTAIMGPNGAGKTTLMEILCGLYSPDSGSEVVAFGEPLRANKQDYITRIGVQLQETQLFDRATPRDYLEFFRGLYAHALPLMQVAEWLGVDGYLDTQIKNLSGGMAQRVAVALAIINDPEIVLLDEPTVGLDPMSRRDLWSYLRFLKTNNKTLIFTTHYMEEAISLADNIIMLAEGKHVFTGPPKAITEKATEIGGSLDDVFEYYVNQVQRAE